MTPVLITRAEADGADFARLCAERGLAPILSPVMTIKIAKADIDLAGVQGLAFTSANGVRAFAANCDVRRLPVFAVGPITAAVARDAGFVDVRIAGSDVESLARHIGAESGHRDKAILHVAGQDRAGDLVSMLAARGVRADLLTLYEASPAAALSNSAQDAIRAAPPLWVSLFSPRTASLFLAMAAEAGLLDRLKHCKAACLSDAVAEKAAAADWGDLVVSAERHSISLADRMAA